MGGRIVSWITGIFGAQIGEVIGVMFIAMLPVIELRGAIPAAFALGLDWRMAIVCAIIGNLIPIPFILMFIESVFKFMKKHNILAKQVKKLEDRAVAKSGKVLRYQFWGLALFVAIPLPGTGGWTGALIASVMKMNKKDALLSVMLGVIAAGIAITMLTYGVVGNIIK